MNKEIFSGLEDLGFDDIENINLFQKSEEEASDTKSKEKQLSEEELLKSSLYDKEIKCPVCEASFKARAVKSSSIRILSRDTDTFIRYSNVNPYFYNIILCPICGYANMESDFYKIKDSQKMLIAKNVTSKWHGKSYPEVYDVNIAIERYKISLFDAVAYGADASRKAMICLKLAWMYRLLEDTANETLFIEQALEGFNDSYSNERFPIYGMEQGTLMYLMGELYRRINKNDEALYWFGKLITSQSVEQKLKEKARDQKDLINETLSKLVQESNVDDVNVDNNDIFQEENGKKDKKKGFLSKLFK